MPKSVFFLSIFLIPFTASAQIKAKPPAASASTGVEQAIKLSESGHCADALPVLRRSASQVSDKDLKRRAGIAGVRCAMNLNQPEQAVDFLQWLRHDFPGDPEVLYVAVHAYSDLSVRSSQELMQAAPTSYQVHELNAESLEVQGKWEEAAGEYRKILQQNPRLPGIHYRLGRVLLSAPPSDNMAEDAKKEFQQELEIDPKNAGAEYVMGELAREAQQWDDAIKHFARATALDRGFTDAFFGLGRSLISADRSAEAIAPLETFVKMQPQEPAGHFQLATAYNHAGRKAEAEKEFALYRQTTSEARQTREELSKKLSGKSAPN